MFEQAFHLRQQGKFALGAGSWVWQQEALLARSSDATTAAADGAQLQRRVTARTGLLAEAERAAVRAGGIAQQAFAVGNAFALVELAGRGVRSRALAGAEAAGRLSLVAQPLHAQAQALQAHAAEQAYLVRAVALQNRPLVAGAEWLAERAVEGAAVARRVHRVQRPLLQVADATTPAQSFTAAQLACRIERGLAPLAALAEKSMLSGRAAPAARSGRWCSRPSSSRRRRSNTPQDFPAWCRPVKAKAPGCPREMTAS